MIKKGDKFKLTGISKTDAYWKSRHEYKLYDQIYTVTRDFYRWRNTLTYSGEAVDESGRIWAFYSIQLKRVKD